MTISFTVDIKNNGKKQSNFINKIKAPTVKGAFRKIIKNYPELKKKSYNITISSKLGNYRYKTNKKSSYSDTTISNTSTSALNTKIYSPSIMYGGKIARLNHPKTVKASTPRQAIRKLLKVVPQLKKKKYIIKLKQKGGKPKSYNYSVKPQSVVYSDQTDTSGPSIYGRPIMSDLSWTDSEPYTKPPKKNRLVHVLLKLVKSPKLLHHR